MGQSAEECRKACTVRDAETAVKVVTSFADPPEAEILPDYLMEVLNERGYYWI